MSPSRFNFADWTSHIVREEHQSFPFELVGLVKELCGLMEIDFGEFEEKLKS